MWLYSNNTNFIAKYHYVKNSHNRPFENSDVSDVAQNENEFETRSLLHPEPLLSLKSFRIKAQQRTCRNINGLQSRQCCAAAPDGGWDQHRGFWQRIQQLCLIKCLVSKEGNGALHHNPRRRRRKRGMNVEEILMKA